MRTCTQELHACRTARTRAYVCSACKGMYTIHACSFGWVIAGRQAYVFI